jgi:hypothetical protein
MAIEKPATLLSFEAIVDHACEGLAEQKIRYSIRRIREMEASLLALEKELDIFLEDGGKDETQ